MLSLVFDTCLGIWIYLKQLYKNDDLKLISFNYFHCIELVHIGRTVTLLGKQQQQIKPIPYIVDVLSWLKLNTK